MTEFEHVNEEGVVIENTNYSQAPGQIGTALIDDNPAAQDYKASQAIKGMPQSETAEKLKLMEKQYELWLSEGAIGFPIKQQGWFKRLALWIAGIHGIQMTRSEILEIAADPLRIFRMEIKELALAYAAELNGKQALLQQADIGREHIKTQAKQAELTKFLQQHFEAELDTGRVRKLDLYEIVQGIMLDLKRQ